jgi:hypothetical protein
MSKEDLERYEHEMDKLVVKVRSLGGYSPHAENEMIFVPILRDIIRHLRERAPRSKKDE